jgi:hypothetical protein
MGSFFLPGDAIAGVGPDRFVAYTATVWRHHRVQDRERYPVFRFGSPVFRWSVTQDRPCDLEYDSGQRDSAA